MNTSYSSSLLESDNNSMSLKSILESGSPSRKRSAPSERCNTSSENSISIVQETGFDKRKSRRNPIVNSVLILYPSGGLKQIAFFFSNNQSFLFSLSKEVSNPILNKRLSTTIIKKRIEPFLYDSVKSIIDNYFIIKDEYIKSTRKNEYYSLLFKFIRDYYSILSKSPDFKDYCYFGYFEDSKRMDRGTEITHNGINRCHFNKNMKEGYCEVQTNPQERAYGEYKENRLSGIGQLHCSNYSMYGDFENNLANGISSINLHNGFISMGEFKNDKKDGYQCCIFPDGDNYVGGLKNGKKNGLGVSGGQNVSEGIYQDDHLINKVSISTADAINYVGDYKNGKPEGNGYIARGLGNTLYEGGLHQGLYHGIGQLIHLSKYSLVLEKGYFQDGKRKL